MTSKKIFFSILLVSVTFPLLKCTNNESKKADSKKLVKETYEGKNVGSPLEVFVSAFLKNHPDMENNDVTLENARLDFAKEFDEKLKPGFLNDMPFACIGVERDPGTNKILASFSVDAASKDSSIRICVFLTASLDEKNSVKLKQFREYKIKGIITRPKNDLDEKYHLGPSHVSFNNNNDNDNYYPARQVIYVHRLKLDLKEFEEIPESL